MFVNVLGNYTVEVVPSGSLEAMDPPPPMGNFARLLSFAVPDGFDMSLDRLGNIFGPDAIADATAELMKFEKKGWRLRVHAEAAMAHFFFPSGRHFVRRDRYIGCSKASCSCCDLYLELHPGNFERRPCHGNTWMQWRFPGFSNLPETEIVTLMRRMVDRMQSDINRDVLSGLRGRVFTLDSSTNMSTLYDAMSLESKWG